MAKSNVYTRTGDTGTTSLTDGSRVQKDSVRLEAYGTLDEFSSFLGEVAASRNTPEELRGQIRIVQNKLFNLGGYLASPPGSGFPTGISDKDVATIESWIDALDEQIPKIRAFILPGGSEDAARAHVARAVCRRAERRIIALSKQEPVEPTVITYINRLSDYLFIAARYLNFINGVEEIIWDKDA